MNDTFGVNISQTIGNPRYLILQVLRTDQTLMQQALKTHDFHHITALLLSYEFYDGAIASPSRNKRWIRPIYYEAF